MADRVRGIAVSVATVTFVLSTPASPALCEEATQALQLQHGASFLSNLLAARMLSLKQKTALLLDRRGGRSMPVVTNFPF